jgi:hypothetical protein
MVDRTDIDAVVEHAQEQLELVGSIYESALQEQQVNSTLQVRIKNVVENQRSALEYVAHAIYAGYGDGKGARSYYPLAVVDKKFPTLFDRLLPGVAATCPAVRDAIEARQPYQGGYEWLHHLSLLTNENKHRRLTPQARTETRRVRVETVGGSRVEYGEGVRFGSGVLIGGVPVDPNTQLPVPSPQQSVTVTTYVDWLFEEPPLSALGTLQRIQGALPSLIDDVLGSLP